MIIYSFKDQDRANLYLELLDDDMGPFSGETVIHFVIFILGTLGFRSRSHRVIKAEILKGSSKTNNFRKTGDFRTGKNFVEKIPVGIFSNFSKNIRYRNNALF